MGRGCPHSENYHRRCQTQPKVKVSQITETELRVLSKPRALDSILLDSILQPFVSSVSSSAALVSSHSPGC